MQPPLTIRGSKSTISRKKTSRWPSSGTPCRTRWRSWWPPRRIQTPSRIPSTIHRIQSRSSGRSAMPRSSTCRSVSARWRGCVRRMQSQRGPPRRPEHSYRPRSSAKRPKRPRNRRTKSAIWSRSASRGRATWPCARTTPRSRSRLTHFCRRPGSPSPVWTSYRCSSNIMIRRFLPSRRSSAWPRRTPSAGSSGLLRCPRNLSPKLTLRNMNISRQN